MTPLTQNPNVTLLIDEKGNVLATATNVASDLKVTVVTDPAKFEAEALGKSFVNKDGMITPPWFTGRG